MKKLFKYLAVSAASMFSFTASAVIPLDYYSSLQGLKGAELKMAIHQLVAKSPEIKMLEYGSGTNNTWWAFYITDRREDNTCVDRYSYETFYFGERGKSITGTNIEHSFPKSWWGSTKNNAYKDLFNLMPCESSINQSKSNYPMGVVTKVTTAAGDNGCTKVGSGPYGSSKFWEPADQWKGDFARGYMYMATAYQDFTWTGEGLNMLQQDEWPTLQPWAYNLFLQWARQDDVAEIEVVRCNQVQEFQHNRNPYVDFPNLMEYVWGDSINVPFNVATTRKSDICSGYVGGVTETLYENTFLGQTGDCTVKTTTSPGFNVWNNNESYGWVAKASRGSGSSLTYYNSDASLELPSIDLSDYMSATLSFEHAVNFAASPATALQVLVRDDNSGEVTDISGSVTWPAGSNWTFVSSSVDLLEFAGKKVTVMFRYTSTTSEACTWEIKNVVVTGIQRPAAPAAPGDVNADGVIDILDCGDLVNIIVGLTTGAKGNPDVNGDGFVDIVDMGQIVNLIVGFGGADEPEIPVITGSGTQEDPYQCWQVIEMKPESTSEAVEKDVWVEGYIVGFYNSYKTYFTTEGAVNHNILLSSNPKTTDRAECIDVQLPSGSARAALNLVDHPEMFGKKVKLKGDVMKYNTMPGLKNCKTYVIE